MKNMKLLITLALSTLTMTACLSSMKLSSPSANTATNEVSTAGNSTAVNNVTSTSDYPIRQVALASHFFSEAMDQGLKNPSVLKQKFCSVPQEQISMYSMQVKARIDDWMAKKDPSTIPPVASCADDCMCDLQVEMATLQAKPQVASDAAVLRRKEDRKACLKKLGDFCSSKLYKELTASVKENLD